MLAQKLPALTIIGLAQNGVQPMSTTITLTSALDLADETQAHQDPSRLEALRLGQDTAFLSVFTHQGLVVKRHYLEATDSRLYYSELKEDGEWEAQATTALNCPNGASSFLISGCCRITLSWLRAFPPVIRIAGILGLLGSGE